MNRPAGRFQSGVRTYLLSLAVIVLLAGSLGAPTPARAEDNLHALQSEWEMISRRLDERGYMEQEQLLDRIAALRTDAAREGLARLHVDARTERQERLILAALVRYADVEWIDRVLTWAEGDRDGSVLRALPEAIAEIRDAEVRAHVWGPALRRAVPRLKAHIAVGLGQLGDPGAVPALLMLVRKKHVDLRTAAIEAVGLIGDARALGPLVVFLQDPDWRIREYAARALGGIRSARATDALMRALSDENPRVLESIARALGMLAARAAVGPLIEKLEAVYETDLRVADALVEALHAITGKRIGVEPQGWRGWWEAVKDTDWKRDERPQGEYTVPSRRYYGFPIRSSKLVFVLDVSRSMGWNERLDTAKEELVRVLSEMPATTRFNIVVYSDRVNMWETKLRPATSSTVSRAIKYIKRQRPDNGTNTWAALQAALRDEEVDTVFFLSDGHPSVGVVVDPDRILSELRDRNRYRHVRIHCVALVRGDPPSSYAGMEDRKRAAVFMERLAEENGGRFQLVD